MKHYDAIVIGSGINSLSSAALLAKTGKKVIILESRNEIGGMASTVEFSPGYQCNIINDTIKWVSPKLLDELNITKTELGLIEPEITHVALGENNKHIFFHRDINKTAESIRELSEKDGDNWIGFTLYIKRLCAFLEKLYHITPPTLPNVGVFDAFALKSMLNPIMKHGTTGIVDLLRVAPMMMPEMMDEWFENKLLRGSLSSIGVHHSSLGPFAASTGYNFLHQHLYNNGIIHNNHFIKGGTIQYAKNLKKIAESFNAEIRVNTKIKTINIDDASCTGVTLENNEIINADIIMSGVDPKNTFLKLIGAQNLNPNFHRQVRNIKYRGSVSRIHFALKNIPQIKNISFENMNTMFSICPNIEYLERASDTVKYGSLPENPVLEFCFPSIVNPTFAPSGKHILSATIQYTPYDLRDQKWNADTNKQLKQIVINTLEKSIPNFTSLIESTKIYSPMNLESEFGLSEGNLNHGEMTLDQFMFMRPTISSSQYKTPFNNLFLCSPGTHPGGGLHGTNALNSVKEILKN